jgi:hypothetical protein
VSLERRQNSKTFDTLYISPSPTMWAWQGRESTLLTTLGPDLDHFRSCDQLETGVKSLRILRRITPISWFDPIVKKVFHF